MSEVVWIDEFSEFVKAIEENDNVVVDFTAPSWCRPCQQFAPHFDAAAEKSEAMFIAVDVDKAPWAMSEYGVRGVPTVKHYRDGNLQGDLKGRTVLALLSEIK